MKSTPPLTLALLMAAPTHLLAASFDAPNGSKFEIVGFTKHEWTRAMTPVHVVPNSQSLYSIDNRNVLSKPAESQTESGPRNSELSMQQLSLGWSHETAGAVSMEARLTYRWRSAGSLTMFKQPDVDYREDGSSWLAHDYTERFIGIGRPDLGSLKFGTQLSRSWSRSDAFSFPVGQSGAWADSGAGYGIFPTALRLTSPAREDGSGKLTAEIVHEGGQETVEVPLPVVISVAKEINDPRYPSFMGIRKASRAKIPILGNGDINVSTGRRVRWDNLRKPETKKVQVQIFDGGSVQEKAAKLVEALLAEKVI